jgi:RND family efflux transporter MFP subunit
VSDLKSELESLRIERDRPASGRRWPLFLLAPVALFLGVMYFLVARQSLGSPEVRTVQSATAASGELSASGAPVLTASGYVVARRKAVVSAKIQGRLAELKVEEGSHAREGEVIARLESTDYEAQVQRGRAGVERAQADLMENQRQLRLARDLARDNVMARNEMEAAESRVKIAEAALGQARADLAFAEAQLQNTLIRAPFTGVVLKKMAEVGESVAPIPPGVTISSASGAIVALADLATLEVEADVAEANVAKLGADQPAEVTVEAFPGRRYKAVLRQVIPTADRTKATVQVKVTILDKDKDLKPEMSARVQFVEPEAKPGSSPAAAGPPPVLVPKEAVATRDGKSVVFEVLEGKVRQRVVETGMERAGQLVVRQGLAGGETLVARPPESLKDGDRVRVKG